MSAITDLSVAVLDCRTCCRHFIESYVLLLEQRERVACPHCGAHYVAPLAGAANGSLYIDPARRLSHRRRSMLHPHAPARRKLH